MTDFRTNPPRSGETGQDAHGLSAGSNAREAALVPTRTVQLEKLVRVIGSQESSDVSLYDCVLVLSAALHCMEHAEEAIRNTEVSEEKRAAYSQVGISEPAMPARSFARVVYESADFILGVLRSLGDRHKATQAEAETSFPEEGSELTRSLIRFCQSRHLPWAMRVNVIGDLAKMVSSYANAVMLDVSTGIDVSSLSAEALKDLCI